MEEPWPIGAHLVSPRRGYVHHGIYAGGGRVIHYSGFSCGWRSGPVEEVTLKGFSGGHTIAVQDHAGACFSGTACVERARMRIGEDRFSLWTNNCEHFCSWCLYDASRSAQTEAILAPLRIVWYVLGRLRKGPRASRATRSSREFC
jgi:hypothetical protein